MIDKIGRLRRLKADTEHSLKFTGTLWYVDGDNGADTNLGTTPDESFATIGAAITASAIGDRIYVMAATAAYDENGLDINKVGLELVCEHGVVISNTTPGTVLVVSANYGRVYGVIPIQAGQTGIQVTGSVCLLEDCLSANCNVGFDIDGFANTFKNCKSNNHATTGFDISDDSNSFNKCIAVGDGSARGFHLSHANAGNNTFIHCQTANNGNGVGEAGYEVIVGADNNIFSFCSMSDGDQKVDAGANNTWPDFSEGSQIVAGQSRDQDLKDIYDDLTSLTGLIDTTEATGPYSYLDAGLEQDIYEDTATTRRRIWLEVSNRNMTLTGTFRIYRMIDTANYDLYTTQAVKVIAGSDRAWDSEFTTNQQWKITYEEDADEGAARDIPYNIVTQVVE